MDKSINHELVTAFNCQFQEAEDIQSGDKDILWRPGKTEDVLSKYTILLPWEHEIQFWLNFNVHVEHVNILLKFSGM